jgi:hypothetical protein
VVESVRRYDAGSSITLVALDEAAAEEGRSLGLSNLLIGRDSLGTAGLGGVDVALVWACSDAETCELGRQLRSAGVPMVVGLSASTGEALSRGGCGFDAVVAAGLYVESALGSLVGFDTWVDIPIGGFANAYARVYRVFRRARLGITLQELADATRGCGGALFVYDRYGAYVTSPTRRLEEGDLLVVVAPTERSAVACVERVNRLFTLAERVYTALESRRPPGG